MSSNPNKRAVDEADPEGAQKRLKNENDLSSSSDSESESSSSSSSSDSSDSSDSESEATTASRTPDLRVCPLRSLMSNENSEQPEENRDAFALIHDDSTTGPVDPVFVDEESSGEAAASAADHDDVASMLTLPESVVVSRSNSRDCLKPQQPPLPTEEVEGPPIPPPDEPQMAPDEPVVESAQQLGPKLDQQEVTMDENLDEDSDFSLGDEEIEALLDKDIAKKPAEVQVPHTEKIKFKLIEKGKNHFDVLPQGWVKVEHTSGMPIYLHRSSRSVSLSRPYHLGTASARRHPIPLNAIPCLSYKKALEEEEVARQKESEKPSESIFPTAKVESVEESLKRASLTAEEYREYCEKLFRFKTHNVKKFSSWTDRRTYYKQAQKEMIQKVKKSAAEGGQDAESSDLGKKVVNRPALPDGTKIISIPVVELEPDNPNSTQQENALHQKIVRKTKKDWVLNPAGKSTVCILHEYLQHSVKKAPTYKYQEMDSSATPYSAVVEINGIEYGRGVGSSKKEAKSEAARLTLEILIPEFKDNLNLKNGYIIKESVDLSFFDEIRIEDPRVAELCNKTSEPSPYAILLTCLQRNYGLGDTNITTSLTPARHKKNKFMMKVNERSVEVICRNKRDGKQMASQKLLQLLHPNVKSWGSLLKMYGSRAISAQKNKKERESEVTGLQTQNSSGHASPNVAILAKLREEMLLLAERKQQSLASIGKLTLNRSLMTANNSDGLNGEDNSSMNILGASNGAAHSVNNGNIDRISL